VERVIPQMKATFSLWSTTCLSACYLLAYPNPAFINVRLPLTTTKTTTVVGVPPRAVSTRTGNLPIHFIFTFLALFGPVHIPYFSFLSSFLVLYPVHCGAPFCFLSIAGISNWRPGVGHKNPLFSPLSHQISFDLDKSGTSAIPSLLAPSAISCALPYISVFFFSFVCFFIDRHWIIVSLW